LSKNFVTGGISNGRMDTKETTFSWAYVFDEPTRILVVDDDPILREFASVYLSTPAASVETVPNGSIALDRLLQDQFDIVLVDIEMPEMDGFELVRRVRAQPSLQHLPIVMLTGREDIRSIDRAYDLGASSFVTKPVNWRELAYQVRYVIRAGRALRLVPSQLADTVNAIVGYANRIAEGSDPSSAAHAQEIAALGHDLLRKLAPQRDEGRGSAADHAEVAPKNAA
jgi:DNA-binding response OmpR family regulator